MRSVQNVRSDNGMHVGEHNLVSAEAILGSSDSFFSEMDRFRSLGGKCGAPAPGCELACWREEETREPNPNTRQTQDVVVGWWGCTGGFHFGGEGGEKCRRR